MKRMVVFFVLVFFVLLMASVFAGERNEKEFAFVIKSGEELLERIKEANLDLEISSTLLMLSFPLNEDIKMAIKGNIDKVNEIVDENQKTLDKVRKMKVGDSEIMKKLNEFRNNSRKAIMIQNITAKEINKLFKKLKRERDFKENGT